LIARAQLVDPTYVPPKFENFFEAICPEEFDSGAVVAALKQQKGLIEQAYIVAPTEDAGVVALTNPQFLQQRYLLPAPVGIGVAHAWFKGADGQGCHLVDIEHAWLLNRGGDDQHEDLPPNIPVIAGFNRQEDRGHGAAVLGVIAALDNTVGVVGIAPQTKIKVASPDELFPIGVPPMQHVAAIIALAATHLGFGDVLLLEISSGDLPVELDHFVFNAIQLITTGGVVVVEAGGNGGQDLDNHAFPGESGAIIVGACVAGIPHSREPNPRGSNFGSKIDCNAWGEQVHTCGSKTNPVASNAYFEFSGTSAASAIIAGVCLLVQQLHRMKHGSPMHPLVLRNVLRDRANGTEASTFFSDRIGVMPDLGKIIANLSL
jgi:hypothetical protein